MKQTRIFFLFSFLFFSAAAIYAQSCKEIIGYYPNWQGYSRNNIFKPGNIRLSNYTILNYCFFKPELNGKITSTDADADKELLEGPSSLIALAHQAGVKVMVSIGGWTLSDNFPTIAAGTAARANFAGDCNKLLKQYNFDGIDIDWEYPGYDEHMGGPADKKNFTVFMKQIRDSIDALGTRTGKQYKLSSCFGASAERASNIEWAKIIPILDMINVMSYDYFGEWDAVANHNSPLYAPTSGEPSFNMNSTFTLLTQQHSVPASKINLGIPFYGRSQKGATALFKPTSGQPDLTTFPDEEGAPAYYAVMANMSKFNYYWDNTAQVPYLLGKASGPASGTFVSYDDKRSIGLKAAYVKSKGARGVIVWDVSHDLMETFPGSGIPGGNPLADTLHQILCGTTTHVESPVNITALDMVIFPNPASNQATIRMDVLNAGNYSVIVYDLLGQVLQSRNVELAKGSNQLLLSLADYKNGYYFIKVQNGTHSISKKLIVNH